ncbi:leucyl aminopeptidase [Timonella senegalensis]|uniref:leucyl aminopeptidase n=1 Tax=Timonella senegalensis TaxID=1465825 RepID=UPI002FDE4CE9
MAELTFTSKDPSTVNANVLVLGVASVDGTATIVGPSSLDTSALADLDLKSIGAGAKADTVVRIPAPSGFAAKTLVLVGLGEDHYGRVEQLRRAAGSVTRSITDVDSISFALPAEEEEELVAIIEGALFGAYAFRTYRTGDAATSGTPVSAVEIISPIARQSAVKKGSARAEVIADAIKGTRDLVNSAPNELFPAAFADIAKATAKGTGVKVSVLDDKALVSGGYGGLVGVGQGSTRGPRLVKVSYSPLRAKRKIALIGKGITFDSGGISIKPAAGMEAMKSDMAGAAAVLHTVIAAAKLGLPVSVTGYLCLAENMPSGSAMRPSDVITTRSGKTVEVLNTDAEGRLVLADGLAAAVEDGADLLVDIATLTGAQMMALGNRVSAVMGTDGAVAEVLAAAEVAGESVWHMPLPEELRPTLDSQVADLANMGQRWGGMLVAGHFLKEFTAERPWAHIDIAGPSYNENAPFGYTPKGGTGHGVRTMLAVLENAAG